jgi:hypothetical protein
VLGLNPEREVRKYKHGIFFVFCLYRKRPEKKAEEGASSYMMALVFPLVWGGQHDLQTISLSHRPD